MEPVEYFVYTLNGSSWCEHSRWNTESEAFANAPSGAQIESQQGRMSVILRAGEVPQQNTEDEILS